MDKKQLFVGQKVYLKPINNNSRFGNKEIEEYEIEKIARKYFYVTSSTKSYYTSIKFSIDELIHITDYASDWKIYFSNQEILDEAECEDLLKEIRLKLGQYGTTTLSLEQLRQIHNIINQ